MQTFIFYMCTYTHTYIHTYIHVYYTRMQHIDIYINMDIYLHVHIHKYVHGNIDTCGPARNTKRTYNSHTYIYTLKYRNPFTQINTDIHIYSTFNIKIYYIYIL